MVAMVDIKFVLNGINSRSISLCRVLVSDKTFLGKHVMVM